MNRPYIFCHMITTIDGKIVGSYKKKPEYIAAANVFYNIAFGSDGYYQHQGWLSGRITTDDNFTHYKKPNLPQNAKMVPEGDFVADTQASKYYVSVDPSGKLAWESNILTYRDTKAHVIEILTEKAGNDYKAFLRRLNISYVIAGSNVLTYKVCLKKLKNLFGIETLMLGGGGVLNWSFIQAGMCDEVSIVVAAVADGDSNTQSLFETRGRFASNEAVGFELEQVEVKDGDSIWVRYLVKKKEA